MNIFDTKEYRLSRGAHIAQCMFDYVISLLAADAFLAKLLNYVGMSDSLIGIISSITALSFLFQLLSIWYVKKIRNIKRSVTVGYTVSQLLLFSVYLIPFIKAPLNVKIWIVVAFLIASYLIKSLVSGLNFEWANSFVAPEKRARFNAINEIVSLLAVIVFTFTLGIMLDKFSNSGELEKGFLFVACSIFIFSAFNLISFILIKNKENEKQISERSFFETSINVLKDGSFRPVIVLTVLYNASRYMNYGFLGIYKTKDLMMSVAAIQAINIFGIILRIFVSRPFGSYSDKKSFASGFALACILEGAACLVMSITTPQSRWLYIVYSALFNISCAGSEMNAYNIVYNYIDKKHFIAALAIKNSIGGVCGMAAAFFAGKILSLIQSRENMIFGVHIYGQQVLCFISFVLFVLTAIYIKKKLKNAERILQ